MAITPGSTQVRISCHLSEADVATAIDAWLDALTINNIYGFSCVIRTGFYVFTLIYA